MASIHSENFDSSGSLPGDWNEGAAVFSVVNAELGVTPSSAPNMLSGLATSTGGPIWANWNTGDGNGGNVTVGSWLDYHVTTGNPGNTGIFCRGTSATMTSAGSAYVGRVNWNTGVPEIGLFVAGSWTSLAIGDGLVVVPDGSVAYLTASGSSLSLAIRRPSDGFYLNSSDGWQSGTAYHLTATDSTLTADGYAGLYAEPNGATFNAFFDDFVLGTPGLPTPGVSGSASAAEAHDAGSMAGSSATVGTAAKTEAHDAAAAVGSSAAHAAMAGAEARDAAAAAGSFAAPASLAAAERRDTAAFADHGTSGSIAAAEAADAAAGSVGVPDCIFTTQEAGDYLVAAGVFTTSGSIAPPESGDVPAFHGDFPAGVIAPTERGDIAAFPAARSGGPTLAPTDGRDAAAFVGAAPAVPYLVGREQGDTAALAGATATAGRIAATERHDAASFASGTAVRGSLSASESGDRAAIRTEARGIPPSFRARERGDTAAFATGPVGPWYNVYMSPTVDAPIDYSAPVATTAGLEWSTGAALIALDVDGGFPGAAFPQCCWPSIAYAGSGKLVVASPHGSFALAVPGTWSFGLRAANDYGEEQNLDAAVTITFDAAGNDISNVPRPPFGLRLIPTAGAGLTVLWGYPAVTVAGKRPTGFHVYLGTGGAPDYGSPAPVYQGGDPSPITAVPYGSAIAGAYTVRATGLISGTTYWVGVRAFNAVGEEGNTATVSTTVAGTGPLPVTGLSAVAVV